MWLSSKKAVTKDDETESYVTTQQELRLSNSEEEGEIKIFN